MSDLFLTERQKKIVRALRPEQAIPLGELAHTIGISESTLRRELSALVDEGSGGAPGR